MLASLTLAPDRLTVRAEVLYARAVELQDGRSAHWVSWQIRRLSTQDGHAVWSARALAPPGHPGAPLALRVLGGQGELSAHQFKGLASALGIWAALRKPPMLHQAVLFQQQRTAALLGTRLAELLEHDNHFGLSVRAAAAGGQVGP
jgi:hypothetical protein